MARSFPHACLGYETAALLPDFMFCLDLMTLRQCYLYVFAHALTSALSLTASDGHHSRQSRCVYGYPGQHRGLAAELHVVLRDRRVHTSRRLLNHLRLHLEQCQVGPGGWVCVWRGIYAYACDESLPTAASPSFLHAYYDSPAVAAAHHIGSDRRPCCCTQLCWLQPVSSPAAPRSGLLIAIAPGFTPAGPAVARAGQHLLPGTKASTAALCLYYIIVFAHTGILSFFLESEA